MTNKIKSTTVELYTISDGSMMQQICYLGNNLPFIAKDLRGEFSDWDYAIAYDTNEPVHTLGIIDWDGINYFEPYSVD